MIDSFGDSNDELDYRVLRRKPGSDKGFSLDDAKEIAQMNPGVRFYVVQAQTDSGQDDEIGFDFDSDEVGFDFDSDEVGFDFDSDVTPGSSTYDTI